MLCKTCFKAGDTECVFLGVNKACARCRKGKVKCEAVDAASSTANVSNAPVRRPPARPVEAGPSTSKKQRSDEAISEDDIRNARKTVASINNLLQEWLRQSPGTAAAYFPLEAMLRIGPCLQHIIECMEHVRGKGWTMREGSEKYEELQEIIRTRMSALDAARSSTRRNGATAGRAEHTQSQPRVQQRIAAAPTQHVRQDPVHNEEENELEEEESSEEDTSEEDESEAEQVSVPQVKEEEQDYPTRPSTSVHASARANAAILRSLEHTKKRIRTE